jgi:hypothetical protein
MAGSLCQAARPGVSSNTISRESPRPGLSVVTMVSACCAGDRHARRFRARGPITKTALAPITRTGSPALAGVLRRTIVHVVGLLLLRHSTPTLARVGGVPRS